MYAFVCPCKQCLRGKSELILLDILLVSQTVNVKATSIKHTVTYTCVKTDQTDFILKENNCSPVCTYVCVCIVSPNADTLLSVTDGVKNSFRRFWLCRLAHQTCITFVRHTHAHTYMLNIMHINQIIQTFICYSQNMIVCAIWNTSACFFLSLFRIVQRFFPHKV